MLKQMKKSSKEAKTCTCNFCKEEGHFFRDCPKVDKLEKLSARLLLHALFWRSAIAAFGGISWGTSSRKIKSRKRNTY